MTRTALSLSVGLAMACGFAATAHAAEVLTHHVRAASKVAMSSLPATQTMRLDVVLPLRDKAGLDAFVAEVSNPASPNFRHYITPKQFTEKFGPTVEDYEAAAQYLVKSGLTIIGGNRDRMDIQVSGPVSSVEKAFNIKIRTYQHPTENRTFYGPDREPTTALAKPLWHVSGLDNYSIPHPLYVKRSAVAKTLGMSPDAVAPRATTGSGPSASFLGSDMRAAYYGGTALTGAGQNLGLFEYEGTDLDDLNTYYSNIGQTNNVPITLTSTDGSSTSCTEDQNCDDGEQTLDMTQALGMAPGLASLTMYVGNTDTAIISAMTTNNPLPTTIGCSWGWTPADNTTLDPYFEQMAAQGQTFFAASGDSSTWSSSNEAWPADDAYVVSVGGTDLTTGSTAGPWKSETAWTDSGGGISPDGIKIPSWQAATGIINSTNKGSKTLRNGPDVAANANFTFYVCSDQTACTANEYGGTSFAAPMWAGFIALANQQAANNGQAPVGYINPVIYANNEVKGALSTTYKSTFHDITSGKSGSYSATTGYDLVTGWGSPQANLISVLTQ